MNTVNVGGIGVGGRGGRGGRGGAGLAVIAGPCVIEDERATLDIARTLKAVTSELGIPFIFKASYDKANRTSIDSYRGPGLEKGLAILEKAKKEFLIPVLTDVHCTNDVDAVSKVVDCIQIPAFLCRQTDLIVAAAATGKPVNIKKGQFMSPEAMGQAAGKALSAGNDKVILTERGTSFGYNNLVVDFRSLPKMRGLGYPVIFDATHSVQLPSAMGTSSGGEREMVKYLARAALAVGVDGIFIEVHPDPDNAPSDGANSIALDDVKGFLKDLKELDGFIRGNA